MSEYTGKKISTFRERFTELCDSDPRNDSSIANALHVSRQTVHYWKLGDRSPKTPTVTAIANYFGVNLAWMMGYDVQKEEEKQEREFTIFVPSKNFVTMTKYMTQQDYENVVKAFEHAYERMKELGVSLDD